MVRCAQATIEVVAAGQVPVSAPLLFTANDCLDIGIAHGSPVSLDDYDKVPFNFKKPSPGTRRLHDDKEIA